jgi:hypothetical protein
MLQGLCRNERKSGNESTNFYYLGDLHALSQVLEGGREGENILWCFSALSAFPTFICTPQCITRALGITSLRGIIVIDIIIMVVM